MSEQFDLIVLGGGRAANLAIPAAKAGWKTALIERDRLGGVCPNRGCVPSKLLIGYGEAARRVQDAGRHFIDATFNGIDLDRVFQETNDEIEPVDGRYEGRASKAGVELVRGEGRFVGPKTIAVAGRQLAADKIVIATGSRPAPTPFPDLPVWTSDALFPFTGESPRSLLVIGGGFIGTELAAFFSAVGVETRLFTRGDRLLSREDPDIEAVFTKEFSRRVNVSKRSSVDHLSWDGRQFSADTLEDGEPKTYRADRALFATGRIPNTEELNLDKTGLKVNHRGFIPVNDHLETDVEGIFAVGDVNGRNMLQHAASFQVYYLRRKFLKNARDPIDESLVAHAVFSHPEVASVGKTEPQLKAEGIPYVSVFEDWLNSARLMAMRIEYPRVKLLVSPKDYRILGAHLVGPEASTLLHQVLTLMRLKNDVRELARMIYIHPALNETLLAAAVKAVGLVQNSS